MVMISVEQLRYVRLGTPDLDRAVAFARRIVGLELVGQDDDQAWFRSDYRDHTLVFVAGDPAFSDGQLCQAAIATNNGHGMDIIEVVASEGGVVEVFYVRPSDGKPFTFWCEIERGGEIRWADEYIGWAKNTRVYYRLLDGGQKLEVRSVLVGYEDEPEIRVFTQDDFE
jgi:catechol 2,3-dioxygenase-like lactoylglutathione lyase family enzyme